MGDGEQDGNESQQDNNDPTPTDNSGGEWTDSHEGERVNKDMTNQENKCG